jgi:hypothetical protein
VLALPTDRPRPALQTFWGAQQTVVLPARLTAALAALSQREGATLFMTLLAAFKVMLYRYTGQNDIVVGSPIANRARAEIEELIGFFVNMLVLRTDLSAGPSFHDLLGRIREVCLGAYAHHDLPFERLVEELQPEREMNHNPLFQVAFVLQNAPLPALQLPGVILEPLEVDSGTARFDLTLELVETERGLVGTAQYDTDLFDAATITRMLGHFQALLEGIIADPARRLLELPLLTEAEHQQLAAWNDTQAVYPSAPSLHELFEAQVARTPDAVAVVFDSRLSRRQGDTRQETRDRRQERRRHADTEIEDRRSKIDRFRSSTVDRRPSILHPRNGHSSRSAPVSTAIPRTTSVIERIPIGRGPCAPGSTTTMRRILRSTMARTACSTCSSGPTVITSAVITWPAVRPRQCFQYCA